MGRAIDREEELERLRWRYQRRGRKGKGRLLDEFCEQYDYERTFTRTSPEPGSGKGKTTVSSTSGPRFFVSITACIVATPILLRVRLRIVQVTVYDYRSSNQLLIDHQIPKPDRRELEDIMDELKDARPETKKSLLQRAEAWVVKHKELLGAAAEAVGKAISQK